MRILQVPRVLQLVVTVLVAGCLFLVGYNALVFLEGAYLSLAGVLFWSVLAVGLIQLHSWARMLVVVMLWFAIIIVPLGLINPFAAMNDYGPYPPSVWVLSIWVYSGVAAAVLVLHLLGTYKSNFGAGGKRSVADD